MGAVTFEQLGRPFRKLELSGSAAPHGRPRQGPVMAPEQRLREDETYLPGSDEQVVHVFGQRREPLKLHGRFRDAKSGKGFAQDKNEEVKRFFSDQQVFRFTWDDVVDVHGLMTNYVAKIESRHEIEWEIEIKVLKDLLDEYPGAVTEVKGPDILVNDILKALALKDALPFSPPTLKGSVVDLLNGLVGNLNQATAALVSASNDIDSFATGTLTALRRFRAGLGQARVAVANLRGTYDNMLVTAALESEASDESQRFWDVQTGWSSSSLEALRLIALAEREAAKAERGNLLALHEAGEGETWQSISERWFDGSADRAEDIRKANGAEVGSEPVPGTVYFVPR